MQLPKVSEWEEQGGQNIARDNAQVEEVKDGEVQYPMSLCICN